MGDATDHDQGNALTIVAGDKRGARAPTPDQDDQEAPHLLQPVSLSSPQGLTTLQSLSSRALRAQQRLVRQTTGGQGMVSRGSSGNNSPSQESSNNNNNNSPSLLRGSSGKLRRSLPPLHVARETPPLPLSPHNLSGTWSSDIATPVSTHSLRPTSPILYRSWLDCTRAPRLYTGQRPRPNSITSSKQEWHLQQSLFQFLPVGKRMLSYMLCPTLEELLLCGSVTGPETHPPEQ